MKQELIQKYIEFAIENWYSIDGESEKFDVWYHRWTEKYLIVETEVWFIFPVILIITSKEFIESVSRWIIKSKWNWEQIQEEIEDFINTFVWNEIYKLTTRQAIAIRDNKLEEFIENILPKE